MTLLLISIIRKYWLKSKVVLYVGYSYSGVNPQPTQPTQKTILLSDIDFGTIDKVDEEEIGAEIACQTTPGWQRHYYNTLLRYAIIILLEGMKTHDINGNQDINYIISTPMNVISAWVLLKSFNVRDDDEKEIMKTTGHKSVQSLKLELPEASYDNVSIYPSS